MRVMLIAFGLNAGLFTLPAVAAPIGIEDVRAMAFDRGIVKLEEIQLDDGVWKVEGWMPVTMFEMKGDAGSGRVIKMEGD
ncbi:MAG: hypothetical protein ACREDO_00080 [Methyloceanibacter sp.]